MLNMTRTQVGIDTLLSRAKERERVTSVQAENARLLLPRLTRILVEEYKACTVVLFGSLAREASQTGEWRLESDIDLAARGIPSTSYYAAQGRLLLESPFPCDLVSLEDAPDYLKQRIEEEGIVLYDCTRS